ncbi:MAG: response regulator [Blautia sp.]|nr:response regulator [Blautia sp.]
MAAVSFELNDETLRTIEEIGNHMPGGFYIYRAAEPGDILYVNRAVLEIYGCETKEQFKELTGFTFKGMTHPDDFSEVMDSISRQIEKRVERMDYVEYRIIRRDGEIRWVDDYGHYTETQEYGGVYYVFISDITEKRARMETDIAMRNAVIEALSESYHTVWLINDVERETFSLYRGDISGITPHGLPNKDALKQLKYSMAKDYYIRTTVAQEDQERLQRDLALSNIVHMLHKKPQYTVTYLRTMEDGSARYFCIEFAKLNMPGGKMGVVCGFKDVDEEVRNKIAVQLQLEQRLALKEQLLEQETYRKQQENLITALAADYWSVYYLNLDTDEGVCYQSHPEVVDGFKVGEHFPYLASVTNYANTYITEPYREEFLRFIQPASIQEGLKTNQVISFRYMVSRKGKESYEMVRFAGVRRPEERVGGIAHLVGACFTDVNEETRRTLAQSEMLSNALTAAEQANKAKTAFLSNMSHEIRTPMNAIIGLNNIALSDPEISEKTREYLEKMGSSARHLLNIINDILDMSRIESGRMLIKKEEFSFSKAIEQVNTIIGGQCRDKDLDYECRIRGRMDDYYIGDDMKLRQVLINLLGNAVKFTPSGGSVTFTIEEGPKFDNKATLRFIVEDNGIGMSPEYLPHIFDAFSQEDSSATNQYGSTGLGMPITKNIVELMNGHIEVESEKGVGTVFTVTVTFGRSFRQADCAPAEGEIHPHQMSVLVIDDDEIACDHARVVLGQVGIRCDIATSGETGVDMVRVSHARRELYDLILVDWKMPGMDGVETTRQIRSIVGHDTAIIILTSYNWEDVADEARSAGVDSFVPKPLFAGTVIDEFREAFKKKNVNLLRDKAELKGKRVLLAEDMLVNAEIMVMVLSMREIDVDVAENGQAAVEMFRDHPTGYYDAILMDMRMPVMDGLEATRLIRAMDRPDARRTPIIALTANAFDEDVQRSMQAGLDAHLSKPVEPEALFETLETLIG